MCQILLSYISFSFIFEKENLSPVIINKLSNKLIITHVSISTQYHAETATPNYSLSSSSSW